MNAVATVTPMPIDPALAKRVRAVAQAAEKKRQERDELILAAHAAGASLREIGDLVGLSHVGVKKIIDRKDEIVRNKTADDAVRDRLNAIKRERERQAREARGEQR